MRYLQQPVSAAPLAVFRILLGSLIFFGIVRFWANGWIESLYIEPKFFFSFYGFGFIKPIGEYTYLLFFICGVSAMLVAVGLFYRAAMTLLFLSFTYIELIDKSTYLNHYYFISMICLLMIFLPAHATFSADASRNPKRNYSSVPRWTLGSLRLFIAIVYVYAGMAKLNSDWLIQAQPLRIWLPAKNDLFLIGPLLSKPWVAYAFSWAGCLYDLTIPFLLLNKPTRPFAFAAVIIFHLLTAILFPIGMFPYIMIGTALVFFPGEFHQRILTTIRNRVRSTSISNTNQQYSVMSWQRPIFAAVLLGFFTIQLIMPLRYWLYPGELFWTEEGYRFSWRVMLMEKTGFAEFTIKDNKGNRAVVDNREFLTPLQEKMMSAQPDMMLQYAHFLRDHYAANGFDKPQVFVDSYVALNGRLGKPLVAPSTDLALISDSFKPKSWILPFSDDIKGF